MGLTVYLEDALADDLRQEASDEHVPVEELAHRLVRDALQQRLAQKRWRSQNGRRLELIAKKLKDPLSALEQEEFHNLQALAYQIATPFDSALLQTIKALRQEVDQLPKEPTQ